MWYQKFREIPFTLDLEEYAQSFDNVIDSLIDIPFNVYDFWDQVDRDGFYQPFQINENFSVSIRKFKHVSCFS